MTARRLAKVSGGACALLLVALLAAGCGSVLAGNPACPSRTPALYLAVDVGAWSRSDAQMHSRLADIERIITQVSGCDGEASVVAYTNSVASTRILFEGSLRAEGRTRIARIRKVPKLVAGVMRREIRPRLGRALAELPGDGTDSVGQLTLANEYFESRKDSLRTLVLLGDGIVTAGEVNLNVPDLDRAKALGLARSLDLPPMVGIALIIAPVGQIDGPAPPTVFIDAVKTFWEQICKRARVAEACIVASQVPTAVFA